MPKLLIEINPLISPAPVCFGEISPSQQEWRTIANVTGEYNLTYSVSGQRFCYYPSSLATLLNDILWEWQLMKDRKAHQMTLSGYTVLEADFDGDDALIYDPLDRVRLGSAARPVGSLSALEVEYELKSKLDAVWYEALAKTRGALRD